MTTLDVVNKIQSDLNELLDYIEQQEQLIGNAYNEFLAEPLNESKKHKECAQLYYIMWRHVHSKREQISSDISKIMQETPNLSIPLEIIDHFYNVMNQSYTKTSFYYSASRDVKERAVEDHYNEWKYCAEQEPQGEIEELQITEESSLYIYTEDDEYRYNILLNLVRNLLTEAHVRNFHENIISLVSRLIDQIKLLKSAQNTHPLILEMVLQQTYSMLSGILPVQIYQENARALQMEPNIYIHSVFDITGQLIKNHHSSDEMKTLSEMMTSLSKATTNYLPHANKMKLLTLEERYQLQLEALRAANAPEKPINEQARKLVEDIIQNVQSAYKESSGKSIETLKQFLFTARQLIKGEISPEAGIAFAEKFKFNQSPVLKNLAKLMIALGTLIAAVGLIVASPIVAIGGGVLAVAGGITFFADKKRTDAQSKTASAKLPHDVITLAKELSKKHTPTSGQNEHTQGEKESAFVL